MRWRDRTAPLLLLTSALIVGPLAAAPPPEVYESGDFLEAAKTILCDCGCHPQSVYDCACGRAAEMRDDIAAMVAGGKNGEAVIASYVAEYGEQIRVAPTATGFNLVAWLGPALALLGAGAGLVLVLRRWGRAHRGAGDERATGTARPDSVDAPYVDRLKSELEEYDR